MIGSEYGKICSFALALMCASVAFADSPPTQASGNSGSKVVMTPFAVSAKPLGSFGISVRARKDPFTPRVTELTILNVAPDSDAELQGLGPLTQILSIDGKDVTEFTASFNKGTDLNAALIDRKKGDRIVLTVLIFGAKKPKNVTLVEVGGGMHEFPYESREASPTAMHFGVSH